MSPRTFPDSLLDNRANAVEPCEGLVPAPVSSVSGLTPVGRRLLRAIGELL
jgi:hypothetical protein